MELKSAKNQPLYEQLVDRLRKNIKNNYKANDKLPSEREIMRMYSVSRNTVRQAFNELEILGFIYRKHGKGTFVAKLVENPTSLGDEYSFTEQMKAIGRTPETRILEYSIREAGEYFGSKLQIGSMDKMLKLKRLRIADGIPTMIDRTYLPYYKFSSLSIDELEKKHRALYSVFSEDFDEIVSVADEEISAVRITDKDSHVLQVPEDSPGMMLNRTTYNQKNEVIEYTISSARSDHFVYKIRYENKKRS
ncbi:GntR family transcriptional regulator [Pediococcus argentinicus]|uniref:GntR family transcriptional regulator n=1 Tax=Pediococcus argentinicus TaxID=480391 RepID=A0A0R2NHX6_9LACO|nr:GntR family transcriptional regulator [Pediococcus argentinicus]KRO25407.1 GntR family transcriptional regulator [Pediococcus argentinicus]NKZ22263.1 GntR family transcriptional regulator [Pediococcus argentinicus]GEP19268.1 GntR family transcriptional regulator [Pediococcus argentinicus]